MTSKIEFQVASILDSKKLADLINSAYRGDTSKVGWTTEAELLGGQRTDVDHVRETILTDNSVVIKALVNKNLIGCVLLQKKEDCCYLGMLTVDPSTQAKGIGKEILGYAEMYIKERFNLNKIEMTVIKQRKELIDWYARRGYQVTSKRSPFPYGNERFGIPKTKDLEFVVLEKKF